MASLNDSTGSKKLSVRWSIIGAVLAVAGLVWFAQESGILKGSNEGRENPNVKLRCPRLPHEIAKVATNYSKNLCALCLGNGFIWVDKTKFMPEEVIQGQ